MHRLQINCCEVYTPRYVLSFIILTPYSLLLVTFWLRLIRLHWHTVHKALNSFFFFTIFDNEYSQGMREATGHKRLGVQWASKVCQGLLLLIPEHVNILALVSFLYNLCIHDSKKTHIHFIYFRLYYF